MKLAEEIGLEQAWRLVSERPAHILGLQDRGRLKPGLRADLVVLEAETGRVGATFCAGKPSFVRGDVAERLMGAI